MASEETCQHQSPARDGDDETSLSWWYFLWSILSYFSIRSESQQTPIIKRRDCSLMDTTPPNDLQQFQAATSKLLGNNTRIIPPWHKTTSFTDIPICHQHETWDCGVACLQMILAWTRGDTNVDTVSYKEERQWMLDTLGTTSIWTIDLLVLLNQMLDDNTTSTLFCSKTLGVDRQHHLLCYYKQAFGKDQVRVEHLFSLAHGELQLNMICLSHLGLAQVIRLVALPHVVALVLLDNSILRGAIRQSYAGHYVVLCGMSCENDHLKRAKRNDPQSTDDYCMVIKNPGNGNEIDYVTPYLLEQAWRANGTDDDIIFVCCEAR